MTKEKLQEILEKCYWRYARTLAHIPHHYTLKRIWKNQVLFVEVIHAINEHSVTERFGKYNYNYFYAGNFKYWHMGVESPPDVELINKSQIKL